MAILVISWRLGALFRKVLLPLPLRKQYHWLLSARSDLLKTFGQQKPVRKMLNPRDKLVFSLVSIIVLKGSYLFEIL